MPLLGCLLARNHRQRRPRRHLHLVAAIYRHGGAVETPIHWAAGTQLHLLDRHVGRLTLPPRGRGLGQPLLVTAPETRPGHLKTEEAGTGSSGAAWHHCHRRRLLCHRLRRREATRHPLSQDCPRVPREAVATAAREKDPPARASQKHDVFCEDAVRRQAGRGTRGWQHTERSVLTPPHAPTVPVAVRCLRRV